MRLCAKTNIAPRAFPYVGHSELLVKIRLGAMLFLASPEEATDLARQLVAAVDKLRDDIGAPMDTDIQAKVSAAVRPVNAIQIHPDLARRVIHWLGKYLELMRQPGQPGVPMLLIETQKALAEALAAMDNSRQREQGTSQALEIIVSGYDACVGTAEAARQLGISPDGVRWHCRKRNLESRKVGRQLMVTTSSIENYKRQKVERSA